VLREITRLWIELIVKRTFLVAATLFGSVAGFVFSAAQAEELLRYKNVSASVSDDYQCQSEAKVRLDAPTEESYRKSRVDMQKMSEIVKTYLWLDCKEVAAIEFEAYAEGSDQPVYRASTEKNNEWFLQENDVDKAKDQSESIKKQALAGSPDDPQSVAKTGGPANTTAAAQAGSSGKPGAYGSLEALQSAAKTSPKAQLELAKGLLDLPGKDESIQFPADQADKGLEILEKLAAEGNADAMQILSEAYSSDKKFSLNIPLIESLTGRPMTQGEESEQRGTASAGLTLEAAANGSELAVDFLQEAGQAGSSMSYYALGMMYLLDKAKKMPYQQEFLSEQLNMDVAGGGGSGNVDVGLHFLSLAAEGGNPDAQELLTDMEVSFTPPASGSGSSSSVLQVPASSQAASSSASNSASSSPASSTSSVSSPRPSAAASAAAAAMSGQPSAASAAMPSSASTAQPSNASTSAASSRAAYSEALIASGALSDILDARSQAASAAASASSASNRSQSSSATAAGRSSSGLAASTGSSNSGSSSGSNAGSGSGGGSGAQGAAANTSPARAGRRSTTSSLRSARSSGNMNSEQNEAEIID
jgi:hypothetical protein